VGQGTVGFGSATSLRFEAASDGRAVVLRGASGLDRDLVVVVGHDPVELGHVLPSAEGLAVELAAGRARLVRRLGRIVRVGGHLVGEGCDLLRGELVEVLGGTAFAFEVG